MLAPYSLSDIQMLPDIIAEPPLVLPHRSLKRTQHIIALVSFPPAVRPPTTHCLLSHAARVALAAFLLAEPVLLALHARCVRVLAAFGRDRGRVLAGHERWVAAGGVGAGAGV